MHHILDSLTKLVYFVHFSRFKALESMMEETLNQSVSIRDDKIHALESRFVCLLILLSGNEFPNQFEMILSHQWCNET